MILRRIRSNTPQPPGRGLSGLAGVPLEFHVNRSLEAAVAGSGGSPEWRNRKQAESHEILALSRIAPERLRVDQIDLGHALRAVIYLNGFELQRSNMPDGIVSYLTFAASAVSGDAEDAFFDYYVVSDLLRTGENVLAVEIHQTSVTSSDISFDLEVLGLDAVPHPTRRCRRHPERIRGSCSWLWCPAISRGRCSPGDPPGGEWVPCRPSRFPSGPRGECRPLLRC